MKKPFILLAIALALAPLTSEAQIFNPYKRKLNQAEKKAGEALKGGADFTLDPIESVPTKKSRAGISAMAQSNWGLELLLPPALRQRLVDECVHKVTVKIADTGMPDHTALRQGQIPGKNYTQDATVNDGNGHGTHVAGIIAADGLGLCDALVDKGILRHKSIKILSDNGSGNFTWVANAIAAERPEDLAALQRGEFVVYNGSFGGGTSLVDQVETELKKSVDAGVFFCFAAGNTGTSGVNYPGNGKSSIAVASLDKGLTRSSYSTTGPEVWNAMPGRDINSTYKGQAWASLSGTSMATPFETAALAVALSKWGPKLKGLELVRAYLAWCAKDLAAQGKDTDTGWGISLIQNILDRDPSQTPGLPTDPPPPPPPPTPDFVSITPLTVTLAKEYLINWDNLGASVAGKAATTFVTGGRGVKSKNKSLALKTTKVRFEIKFQNDASAAAGAAKLEAAADKYFQNRGFMIPAKQDETWAAVYAGFFLEQGLSMQNKFEVDVSKITLTTSGQTVTISDPILWHWPRK